MHHVHHFHLHPGQFLTKASQSRIGVYGGFGAKGKRLGHPIDQRLQLQRRGYGDAKNKQRNSHRERYCTP
jgi:hypothetical protein